ncbi:MAG: carbohydrate ABC transporter permease [Anaerolineae bacterium]|nr:carbohydrate ABC transporter permease [Anaerolineae bacterium]
MVEDRSWGSLVFRVLNRIFLGGFALFCLLPFWVMIVAALTDDKELGTRGYWIWAEKWSLDAFRYVLAGRDIQVGYRTSVLVTVTGTLGALVVMSGLAYVLATRRFRQRRKMAFYVFFTMIFNGGMIPWFITCRNLLRLTDTIWALILPMMCNAFWVLVMRGFFERLPQEILESAVIDGASDAVLLYRIVLPLSSPVLATVGLFMAVDYWNDWFLGVMLLDFADFRPLAVIIMSMLRSIQSILTALQMEGAPPLGLSQVPAYSVRMATAAITIGPIILMVPFVQRYFVRGLTLGGVKG